MLPIRKVCVGGEAVAAVRLDALETQPVYHPISQLVYATGRQQVSDVWIAGVRKVENGALLGLDVEELTGRAQGWVGRIGDYKVYLREKPFAGL